MKFTLPPILCSLAFCAFASYGTQFDSQLAWEELVTRVKSDYAYKDRVKNDIDTVFAHFKPAALQAKSEKEFIDLGQALLRNLRDPHLNMGPSDDDDYSVYPTGSDIYAQIQGDVATVIDVKAGAEAFNQGIRPGMQIVKVDGLTITAAIEAVTGVPMEKLTQLQKNYGINIALGGKRYQARSLDVITNDAALTYQLAPSYNSIIKLTDGPKVEFKNLDGIGYIRFNNALGDRESVTEFKHALQVLLATKALIVDLRNTPSGGNTGVAEPILGHFSKAEAVYQRYQVQASGEHYSDAPLKDALVTPQQPLVDKPFVVLAGRWTGSMGEGMTIGLDALGAKAIIGAPMADLLGGIKRLELKESDAWLELGFERMFHVDGRFREDVEPTVLLKAADIDAQGNDSALAAAIEILSQS
jgi:carboxyl-terminal processing protease